MKQRLAVWILGGMLASRAIAQPGAQEAPLRVPQDIAAFYTGQWRGAGEFASGKTIEADASFALDLDGQWLAYRHTDRAPNRYKAFGLWGFERTTRKLTMTVNDNFGSARVFVADDAALARIAFVRPAPEADARAERFTFERVSDDGFKMTYETRRGEQPWQLGDYLVFTRVKP